MHELKSFKASIRQLSLSAVFFLLAFCLLVPGSGYLWAADKDSASFDKAGQEAFRLWSEKEKDRAVAEAVRRYWDYWLSQPSRGDSGYRLWFELEQTQKWLKDPKKNRPPPPPPPPGQRMDHYHPPYPYYYPYPPPYYHPQPYYSVPPGWTAPPPYYPYPGNPWEFRDEGR